MTTDRKDHLVMTMGAGGKEAVYKKSRKESLLGFIIIGGR